jgi:hypothetical protein
MTSNKQKIVALVLTDLEPGLIISEEMIRKKVEFFSIMHALTEEETTEVVHSLQAKLSVRMDRGACVKEKYHKSWYYTAKKDHKSDFWDRYHTYLSGDVGFNADVINALDKTTDEMMDMLGNPSSEESFSRRGLVIGDVQSGKTATYTALINKAADDGYRIIILLTGTIEKLRRQTQGRLDEGFVGLDSTAFIRDKNNIWVGVGNINPSISGWAITSTSSDFNTSTAAKLSGRLSGISEPILFVLKKNKSVLEKLEQWLRIYNASPVDKKIHMPMLLIDDEADNASVNTKKAEDDPTTINASIRKLLKLFVRTNYVGFTATPFANIFINPDSESEMLEDDLFPRDFIYALEAPTNYVGARGVFSEEGKYSYMLKSNDDCEFYIPEKHKKEFVPTALPKSLKEAIASFFIANAVRDLRGHKTKHRSMLINVSRFIAVQDSISVAVDGYVREMQREVKNYYNTGTEALKYESFSFIKSVYIKHFLDIPGFEYSWDEIQAALYEAIASIVVRTVNGGNAPKNLNYDECEDEGLRLIAIGGYSLSRGLTLEGLCVSYFYRNSKMYDTLMQMGRWFGYRDSYADICQIWMAEEAIDWYNYISVASDELRREVRRMKDANLTPRDFGLSVRSDISALLVTARNKMRTAKDHTVMISLNGKVVETPYIHIDKEINKNNLKLVESWIASLETDGYLLKKDSNYSIKNYQILNVPRRFIIEFLGSFNSHYLNMDFHTEELVNLISNYDDGTLDLWDIVIASGNGSNAYFCGKEINYITRRFGIKKDSKALQLSGKGSRLGSANFAKGGLTIGQVLEIEEKEYLLQKQLGQKHGFSQELYFNSGIKRNPLLVIYPVELTAKAKDINNEDRDDPKRMEYMKRLNVPVVGLSIGIPRISGKQSKTYQYKINLVKFKELLGADDEYEEIDETIDEE